MRTIRFARHHHPKDETKSAEPFLVKEPAKAARSITGRQSLQRDQNCTRRSAICAMPPRLASRRAE
jgi:hypothetical protein